MQGYYLFLFMPVAPSSEKLPRIRARNQDPDLRTQSARAVRQLSASIETPRLLAPHLTTSFQGMPRGGMVKGVLGRQGWFGDVLL